MQTGGGFGPERIQMNNPGFLLQLGHNYVIVLCTNTTYEVHRSPFLSCSPQSTKQEYQTDETGKKQIEDIHLHSMYSPAINNVFVYVFIANV